MKPQTRNIRGVEHTLVLFKVVGRDAHGRPRTLEVIYDEETTNIQGGEEFVTAFVQSVCVAKRAS